MKRLILGLLVWLLPAALHAQQSFSFTGQWDLMLDITIAGEAAPCSFAGRAEVNDAFGDLSGTINFTLISGPESCPPEMMASVSGFAKGTEILQGVLFGGMLGEASFSGTVNPEQGAKGLTPVNGTFSVYAGPFDGLAGGWSGNVSDDVFMDGFEAPLALTASSLLLGLLAVGGLMGRQRRRRKDR